MRVLSFFSSLLSLFECITKWFFLTTPLRHFNRSWDYFRRREERMNRFSSYLDFDRHHKSYKQIAFTLYPSESNLSVHWTDANAESLKNKSDSVLFIRQWKKKIFRHEYKWKQSVRTIPRVRLAGCVFRPRIALTRPSRSLGWHCWWWSMESLWHKFQLHHSWNCNIRSDTSQCKWHRELSTGRRRHWVDRGSNHSNHIRRYSRHIWPR